MCYKISCTFKLRNNIFCKYMKCELANEIVTCGNYGTVNLKKNPA